MVLSGQMMHRPLLVNEIMRYAADIHPATELVSATVEGGIHRYTYADSYRRIAQLAHGLRSIGAQSGDRIATLAWNGYRHFEIYYAVGGMGAVCHTLNPRLFAEQLVYIVSHANDRIIFTETTFLPILEGLRDQLPAGIKYVVLADRAHMPENCSLANVYCYEDLLAGQAEVFDWPEFDENTACALCYTSGTTGNPKGSLYSHRSNVLHALFCAQANQNAFRAGQKILPVVPLFHANAWGLPYVAPLAGVSLVFPGPHLDGASVFDLMDREGVFSAWGVPTVWLMLLNEMDKRGRKPNGFTEVVIGGAAAPPAMIERFERDYDVCVNHAWGMTEMSPIGTIGTLAPAHAHLPLDERLMHKRKQGRRMFGVDLKIVDDNGRRQPHDGKAIGDLYVRGNAIVSGYFENPEATREAFDSEGWFKTGDVAAVDSDGYLIISDRSKDLVKSGGEWISSIDLENEAMAHPGVANCAIIAIPHPKWDERPLLVVVKEPGADPTPQDILDFVAGRVAKWQVPDDVQFVDELPMTATGKISKKDLRVRFSDYVLPDLRDRAS